MTDVNYDLPQISCVSESLLNQNFKLFQPTTETIVIGERLSSVLSPISPVPLRELITLLPLKNKMFADEIKLQFNSPIVACDFYIEDAENQKSIDSGFCFLADDIINIDHHANDPRMFGYVSSGTLAAQYVEDNGTVPANYKVVINHTDCDSVISSLIMKGLIPPSEIFKEAVICADHSAEINPIADLLQAIDIRRDLAYSVLNLANLLQGKELEPSAAELYFKRLKSREETSRALNGSAILQSGDVAVVVLSGTMRNEFLPALLPEASVILTFEEGKVPGHLVTRLRLGNAAPSGFTLFDLEARAQIDPNFGGRWNAGSNKRGGGTFMSADEYISKVNKQAENALSRFR